MSSPANDVIVGHGYTFADLNSITRAAVVADRLMAMPVRDRFDIAWSAIALQLCESETWIPRHALVRTGWQAIYRHVRDGLRERGWSDGNRDWSTGQPTMPRFVMFWGSGVVPSHEDAVIESVAVGQVLDGLRDSQREAVVALAVHGDYATAASALGLRYGTLTVRLAAARRTVDSAWFEGETPPRRRPDRRVGSRSAGLSARCGQGHAWTDENTRMHRQVVRGKVRARRVCRACEAARAAVRSTTQAAT